MSLSILYVLKLSISLSVIWLFYQLMLRRLTFYNLNRWYLLGYSLLSFVIPLVNIGSFLQEDGLQGTVIQYIPPIGGGGQGPAREVSLFARLGPQGILWGVLLSGSVLLLVRLVVRWLSLRQVRLRGRLVSDARVKIFQVDQPIRPFSFGSAIYINPTLHTEQEYSAIILHEYVHIRQRHTVDILLSELVCILNWFNPFVWLIRRSIRQNLEFIADRKVLEKGVDRKGYQYHLLQVVGVPGYSLATNFNFSSLKKRIIMMNKIKSTRVHLLKFLFLAPMLAVLLLAFRGRVQSRPAASGAETAVKISTGDMRRSDTLGRDTLRLALVSRDTLRLALVSRDKLRLAPVSRDTLRIALVSRDTLRLVRDSAQPVQKGGAVVSLTTAMLGPDAPRSDSVKPLFIVDGVLVDNRQMAALSPNDIESITVLKGKEAVKLYGDEGANGVLLITTKKSKTPASGAMTTGPVMIRLSDSTAAKPLFYLDGVEISPEQMKAINPSDIESINVLRGEGAIGKYGEKGRNGVVLIQSKKKGQSLPREQTLILDSKNKTEGRMTLRADTIKMVAGKDWQKSKVYFLNGVKVADVTQVEPMFVRKDVLLMENTDRPEYLRKYGEPSGKTLINLVTQDNKDNPNAYILDYQHPEDPRRTP